MNEGEIKMDRYTKGFVQASLVYFFLAAGFGIWMGMFETTEPVRFAHVHFNLLGFMAMMHNADEKKILAELNEAAGPGK